MAPSNSRRLVDPELLPLLDSWPQVALSHDNLAEVRRLSRLPAAEPVGEAMRVRLSLERPADTADAAMRIYTPADGEGPWPCIFHIHGGGYVMGAAEAQDAQHRAMVVDLACIIVSTDYRLAPETPAPGAAEDCYAGLSWIVANAARLNIDPGRIGIMGESAGAGLAASVTQMARDRRGPRLAFQHLIYPMLDDRTVTRADPHPHAGEFIWTPHNNRFGWTAHLGHEPGAPNAAPYAVPARADSLADLPPAFIATGGLDLFLEEDLDYARRLMRAGVPVELHVYPGGFHGFDFDPSARVSAQAVRDSRDALRRGLHQPI